PCLRSFYPAVAAPHFARARSFFCARRPLRSLPSSPTRRSSVLFLQLILIDMVWHDDVRTIRNADVIALHAFLLEHRDLLQQYKRDRKSTRLNSSHVSTSYAVSCSKKNNINHSNHDCALDTLTVA